MLLDSCEGFFFRFVVVCVGKESNDRGATVIRGGSTCKWGSAVGDVCSLLVWWAENWWCSMLLSSLYRKKTHARRCLSGGKKTLQNPSKRVSNSNCCTKKNIFEQTALIIHCPISPSSVITISRPIISTFIPCSR